MELPNVYDTRTTTVHTQAQTALDKAYQFYMRTVTAFCDVSFVGLPRDNMPTPNRK